MNVVRLRPGAPVEWPASALTIGNFDGVHRGHRRLVETTRAKAPPGAGSVVLTFEPHPSKVLRPEEAVVEIMTLGQKLEALESLDVDTVALLRFDQALAEHSPAEFVEQILVEALKARLVVVGDAFRFGRGRSAGVDELGSLGAAHGVEVHAIPPVLDEGQAVSSSRIRRHLLKGEVDVAERLLGHPFRIAGRVVRGAGRGRTIGVPTANIDPATELIPARGVYAGQLSGGSAGTDQPAVVNIGTRPTFDGRDVSVEAHLLAATGDFYGDNVSLALRERLREERRFPNAAALVAQIRQDIDAARAILESRRSGEL